MKTPETLMQTIEVLEAKLRDHERAANRYKQMINELCVDAGVDTRYAIDAVDSHTSSAIRSDRFHGLALATAVREYLEMRKSADLGPASVTDILGALKQGGYAFTAKDDENAKRGLRESLSKNTAIFYKLPNNGNYGLRAWYPNIKEPKEAKPKKRPSRTAARRKAEARKRESKVSVPTPSRIQITPQEVPDGKGGVVADVVAVLREAGQRLRVDQIASALQTRGRNISVLPLSGQLSRFAKAPGSPLRQEGKGLYGLAEWEKQPQGKAAM